MKKACRVFFFVFVPLLILSACAQPPTRPAPGDGAATWEEQYELGVRYLSDGNYEEAIIAFTAAIEIDPKRSPAYVGRGDAHSGVAQKLSGALGDTELPDKAVSSYENAVADYLAALDLDESTAEVYRKAAEVYVALGDLDSAITLLERGVAATEDEDLQGYLDKLIENQSEGTTGVVTVLGHIIYNPNEYRDSWNQYLERYEDNNNRITCLIIAFGIRFDSPVGFGPEITLQEAEAGNLDIHFDHETDLYNENSNSPGPMIGRPMELTGYFVKRDPPGELTGPERNNYGFGEVVEYGYHPNGDYVFFVEGYKLLG